MNEDSLKELISLAQLDIDATFAYEAALKNIEDKNIHERISQFKQDHVNHIDELSMLIKKYNGTPPEKTKDFKGYFIEGFTSLRSMTGLLGSLKAMKTNEILTNQKYREAVENYGDAPAEVISLLKKNYEDEKGHLQYIEQLLQSLDS